MPYSMIYGYGLLRENGLHRLFVWFGSLIVIVLFTALIAPYFINWTAYKRDFEREASRVIGHDVEVLGKTDVRLLPLPSVTFNGLSVGKNAGGTPIMTTDQFVMNIELMPLLKGEIRIINPTLIRPRVEIYLDENSMEIWPEHRKSIVDPERISLKNFAIINAEIKIHDLESRRIFSLEQMDGSLDAQSLYGPWFIKADGYVQGRRTHIKISTGRLQNDGSMRVNLTAQRSDLPYNLSLGGSTRLKGGKLHWDGEYKLVTQNEDRDGIQNNRNKEKQFFPVSSYGKFEATMRLIEISQFSLEIGEGKKPYKITGAGSIKIDGTPSFKIQADGKQINLDWVGTKSGDDSGDNAAENSGINLERHFGVLRHFLEKIPVPSVRGTVVFSSPVIVAGGAPIREVSMVVSPDDGGWKIKQLNGLLPGDTKFEARGKIDLRPTFSFKGSVLIASRYPSGFAAWLGVSNASIRKLHSAGFMADVVLSENEINLAELQLIFDKTVLGGSLSRLTRGTKQAEIVAFLDSEEMDLNVLAALFAVVNGQDAGVVSGLDLNVRLRAGKLSGFGVSAEKVDARFRLSGESISIEKLEAADFLGVSFASLGRIENFLEKPDGFFELKAKSQDASRLARFIQLQLFKDKLPKWFFQSGFLDKDIDLVFTINARSRKALEKSSKGQLAIRGEAGGSKIEIITNFEGSLDASDKSSFDISSTLGNENPSKLLMQLRAPVLPVDVTGPLTIVGSFVGSLKNGFDTLVTAQMPETGFSLSGKIYPVGDNAGAAFRVRAGIQDIAPLALLAGIGGPLQIFADKTIPASFSGDFKLRKNRIDLDNGNGQIGGQGFSLELGLERQVSSNKHVTGKLTADSLPLPLLVRMGFVNGAIDAGDNWSQENFGQPLLWGVDGEIELNVGRSNFGIGEYAENIKGKLALADGSINLNDIKGEWLGGNFAASLSLANDGEKASLGAQYEFRNISARSIARILGSPDFISADMSIKGELRGSGRSPAAIVSSMMGGGAIDLRDVKIFHFNGSPLKSVFAAIDKKGFEISDENVLPVLNKTINKGEVAIDAISFPYIVEAGKFLARNIFSKTEKVATVGTARIDIMRQTVDSELSVRFDPGEQWVGGVRPQIEMMWSGSLKAPMRSINVQALSVFLSLGKFEREQRQADLLQASILEKGRLQRDLALANALTSYRRHLREKELYRKREELLKRREDKLHEMEVRRYREFLADESVTGAQ